MTVDNGVGSPPPVLETRSSSLAVGETIILLHPPPPLAGVSEGVVQKGWCRRGGAEGVSGR